MKERNKQMDVLLCLGMLLVILGHVGTDSWRTELYNWFVIYSFHMPLFFFVSGYFYKPEKEQKYVRTVFRLVKKFVIPYYVWNLIYLGIITWLKEKELVRFALDKGLKNFLITPWTTGDQYQLNSPAWFLLTLFLVELVYLTLRKLLGFLKVKNNYILLVLFLLAGIVGGGMMVHGLAREGLKLVIAKMLFGICFYHLGQLYKTDWEKRDKLNSLAYFGILFVIQYFLMVKTKGFPYISMWNGSITTMGKNVLLPVAVGLTGIALMLRVSRILTPSLGDSKVVKKISTSTKPVMIHHYAVIVFFNVGLSLIHEHLYKLPNFDAKWNSVLYKWPGPHNHVELFSMVYIVICLAVPIAGSTFFQYVRGLLTEAWKSRRSRKQKGIEAKEAAQNETEQKETEQKETEQKEAEIKETEIKETESKETEPKETEPNEAG